MRCECETFLDMLFADGLIAVQAFGGQFVAADGTLVFFWDFATARGLRVGREGRAGVHVEAGLSAWTEIEGKVAIVGSGVAGCR